MALTEIKKWFNSHYILNAVACLLYLVTKMVPPICFALFEPNNEGECQLDWRDTEILMFLCFVVVIKNRRWKPLTSIEYISNIILFGKCANALLFFRQDMRWGTIYLILCLILFVAFPEPIYKGPENITFFRGQALDEELLHNPRNTYIVEFYANWASSCTRLAGTFAKLSIQYGNEFMKFGKLDVNKYEKIAQKYRVDVSVTSKNLPTIIIFQNGKEVMRRPTINSKGEVEPYIFKEDNIIRDLNLNELYSESKKKESSKTKKYE